MPCWGRESQGCLALLERFWPFCCCAACGSSSLRRKGQVGQSCVPFKSLGSRCLKRK